MTEVDPLSNPEYTYVQVANAIEAHIASGEFTSRLPAERDLARRFGVSYQTVRHGIGLLRDRGLVITGTAGGTSSCPTTGQICPVAGKASTGSSAPERASTVVSQRRCSLLFV